MAVSYWFESLLRRGLRDKGSHATMKSTWYYGSSGVITTAAGGAGTLYATPFSVLNATAIDRIGISCTVLAATSVVRLGVYTDTGDGLPSTLLFDAGTVDTTATGFKTITIAKTLPPGNVWLAAVAQGGTPTLNVVSGSFQAIGSPSMFQSAGRVGVTMTGVTGALPATFSATPAQGASAIAVMVRVA